MPYDDTNIYKTARQKAGITREKAAEAMGISVESLKAYETYGRLPSCDVVDRRCRRFRSWSCRWRPFGL